MFRARAADTDPLAQARARACRLGIGLAPGLSAFADQNRREFIATRAHQCCCTNNRLGAFGVRCIAPTWERGIGVGNGAKTSVYLATSPEVEGRTGGYYAKSRPAKSTARSHDQLAAHRLWTVSETMVAPEASRQFASVT